MQDKVHCKTCLINTVPQKNYSDKFYLELMHKCHAQNVGHVNGGIELQGKTCFNWLLQDCDNWLIYTPDSLYTVSCFSLNCLLLTHALLLWPPHWPIQESFGCVASCHPKSGMQSCRIMQSLLSYHMRKTKNLKVWQETQTHCHVQCFKIWTHVVRL